MVMPLVDEDKPKCYLCHRGFDDIVKLREHQRADHADFEPDTRREPAPGDVTLF